MRNAAVMLIVKEGRILAVSRRYDKTKFGLPGGKVEPEETPEQAAIRETLEETGIKVTKCQFIFLRDEPRDRPEGEDFHAYCYYATEWEGQPHDSEEGHVEWLTERELIDDKGAFADYNTRTLAVFKTMFPDVSLIQKRCPGGCNNTGWLREDNEGFICDYCDRACTCDARGKDPKCYVHQGE
jgi:8-oxo-dGTP diphosphatase